MAHALVVFLIGNGCCVLWDGEKRKNENEEMRKGDGRVFLATQPHSETNGTSEDKHNSNDQW